MFCGRYFISATVKENVVTIDKNKIKGLLAKIEYVNFIHELIAIVLVKIIHLFMD